MSDDAERFAKIDGGLLEAQRKRLRVSDKRTDVGARRYLRSFGHHNKMIAACTCSHQTIKPNVVCPVCDGAILTIEERARG